jgi:cation-transporting ATPase 13A3/4/5
LGPNAIPFRTHSWLELVANEFSSYLYLYQLTFFLVWLWFGGLIWCSPQIIVVLVCAGMSIKITRSNQLKIQQIGEAGKESLCTVTRDGGGSWGLVRSEELVPGDLIKLTGSNWVLPCDAVVIKGTCVCDESGLTGESMPVRKIEVPAVAGEYNAHRDGKHTLFAGTTLLQAEARGSVAVVTQTGIRTAKGELVSAILYVTLRHTAGCVLFLVVHPSLLV